MSVASAPTQGHVLSEGPAGADEVCAPAMSAATRLLDEPWTLNPSVALRPEPFGALAYHFGNRKLTFLKRPELVAVVTALADHDTVRGALDASGVPAASHQAYADALLGLAEADMVHPRPAVQEPTP